MEPRDREKKSPCCLLPLQKWPSRPAPFYGGPSFLSSRPLSLRYAPYIFVPAKHQFPISFFSDVIKRLNLLRGKSMARHYSWSSKRSYKNGFVWHDLAENDFIYPSHGHEYVLKGSELLDSSINLQTNKPAADASTQTDERRRRRSEEEEELSREEISPPPSDSSPETLMKADGRLVLCAGGGGNRMKASSVLMQLLSCGSISFRDCGPASVKDERLSFVGQYKGRAGVKLENKEYFSGSLIETQTQIEPFPAFKSSSSYNADRSSQLQLGERDRWGLSQMHPEEAQRCAGEKRMQCTGQVL